MGTWARSSFSYSPCCKGGAIALILVLQNYTYRKGGKKFSQIVLMHQCAKCNSSHVSTRLRESAPVIINDLTGREMNV